MQKPVAMPRGGITIFFSVTGLRPSRTRQARTPTSPTRETSAVMTGFESICFLSCYAQTCLVSRLDN